MSKFVLSNDVKSVIPAETAMVDILKLGSAPVWENNGFIVCISEEV